MAPQPANDAYTWIPPTPSAVLNEAGYQAPLAGVGFFAGMGYTQGWTCQTYLGFGSAGISQTYSVEAPAEEPEPEPEPEVIEPIPVAVQKEAGVPPDATVTIADQKAGVVTPDKVAEVMETAPVKAEK